MIANKMLFLFLLFSHTSGEKSLDRISCDGIIFNDIYYDKELLFNNNGRPYNLIHFNSSGILFFSHTIQKGISNVNFGITACYIQTRGCNEISGVPGGYAIAHDPLNDDIYFGGHDGIYKYNFLNKDAEFFAEQGKSIWDLFVKNHFYYIEYPSQKLYVYQDGKFVKVSEAQNIEIDHFFISKSNDIYFSNKTALYKINRKTKNALNLSGEIAIRKIVQNAYGDVFFLSSDGIYMEDKLLSGIKNVAKIHQAFGLTFDGNDNPIYSDKHAIYRLQTSESTLMCGQVLNRNAKTQQV